MGLDVATVTSIGTAVATIILSIAPLIRAFKERVVEPPPLLGATPAALPPT